MVSLKAPYRDHLLSQTLFRELFQHNLVSADGRIKGSREEFNKYRSNLALRNAERTTLLYEMRSQLVEEADKLLKIRDRSPREEILLKRLLDELDLELTDSEICDSHKIESHHRYLGSTEPMLSLCERKIKEETYRMKVMKRDLKILDEWLENISKLDAVVIKSDPIPTTSWKDFKKKHHTRVFNRMTEMDCARHNLITNSNTFNDSLIRKLLAPRKKKIEGNRLLRKNNQQFYDLNRNYLTSSKKCQISGVPSTSNMPRTKAKSENTPKGSQERVSKSEVDDLKLRKKNQLKKASKNEGSLQPTTRKLKEKLEEDTYDNSDLESSITERLDETEQNDSQENVRKKLDFLDL
ncbi:uncharacterized protein NPIL_190261 [Nephila pilipes]|uniref:Uncharacterized protein n=1 Tax=Nephila pilipes TaxID=299642 RepID=A0A8X6PFQ5_NEPPI|nr:uncharacterized protein NPIL_190261 [Nephila pilipes]